MSNSIIFEQSPFYTSNTQEKDDKRDIQTFKNDDGTISSYFDKRKIKIAPRSTLQFKIGPSFTPMVELHSVTNAYTNEKIQFIIRPRIDRGFDLIDGEWIGYKRNYFTLVTSFETPNYPLEKFLNTRFLVSIKTNEVGIPVEYFSVKLLARCMEDNTYINLIQHTAKRDKGPQFSPPMHPLVPAPLPNHQTIREASNVRNESKQKKFDKDFYLHRDRLGYNCKLDGIIHTYPLDTIKKVARYERIQFASSIALKKPTQQTKHFVLQVVLGAIVRGNHSQTNLNNQLYNFITHENATFIPIITVNTPPLIIRGRSPSNYETIKENSRQVESSQINDLKTKKINKQSRDNSPSIDIELKRRNKKQKKDTRCFEEVHTIKNNQIPFLQNSLTAKDFERLPGGTIKSIDNNELIETPVDIQVNNKFQIPPDIFEIQYDPFSLECVINRDKLKLTSQIREEQDKMNLEISNLQIERCPSSQSCNTSFNSIRTLSSRNSTSYILRQAFKLLPNINDNSTAHIPRAMAQNPMDISFCLNIGDESSRPHTSKSKISFPQRVLTATTKPSDLLNSSDLFDEPSFFTINR